jgi:hypothetical protein
VKQQHVDTRVTEIFFVSDDDLPPVCCEIITELRKQDT